MLVNSEKAVGTQGRSGPKEWVLFVSKVSADPGERTASRLGTQKAGHRWVKNTWVVRPWMQLEQTTLHSFSLERQAREWEGRRSRQGQQSSTSEDGGRGAVSRRRSWMEVEGGVLAHRYGKGEEWGHTGSGQVPAVLFRRLGRRPRAQHTQAQFGPAVREMTKSAHSLKTCWVPSAPPKPPSEVDTPILILHGRTLRRR